MRDCNLSELPEFIRFALEHDVEVRFIEPMPLGSEKNFWRQKYVPADEMRAVIRDAGFYLSPLNQRSGFGPASRWGIDGTRGSVGFISQMSCTKCATCNKLRITSDATLRPCLLAVDEVSLRDVVVARDEAGLTDAMRSAFLSRPAEYSFVDAVEQSLGRSMQCIGG
jgi:cyclic pyranopterin phosphate synthase